MLVVGVREYTCILFNFFILNGTTWGSGKKGGQGWGETLVITIVVQGAGYYPPIVACQVPLHREASLRKFLRFTKRSQVKPLITHL